VRSGNIKQSIGLAILEVSGAQREQVFAIIAENGA
jgi:hypothetical protein